MSSKLQRRDYREKKIVTVKTAENSRGKHPGLTIKKLVHNRKYRKKRSAHIGHITKKQ